MNEHDLPQQLTLLPTSMPASDAPLRFRLDAETRRRGLRHVAAIRRQLAERQVTRTNVETFPIRREIRSTAA